jgi:excisionase family DNA binding protein
MRHLVGKVEPLPRQSPLDIRSQICYICVMEPRLTTTEAAETVGIDRTTLQRWIRTRTVRAPKLLLRNGRAVRLWDRADLQRLREVKERTYRRGRGRRPKLSVP